MRAAFNPMNKQPTAQIKQTWDTPENGSPNWLLVPLLFYQTNDWLGIILMVSIGLLIAAVVIGAFLLILLRRSSGKKRPVDSPATPKPKPLVNNDELADTLPGTLTLDDDDKDKDDTEPSLPVIKTVGEPNVLPISGQRPANISWEIASLTDVGLKRELNEDNMLMVEAESPNFGPYGVYVVADGLGGHVAGEVASQLTVDAIQQQIEQNPPSLASDSIEEWLRDATTMANEVVLLHQQDNEDSKRMGSTLVMALVAGDSAHIMNVGDSRAYHIGPDKIEQVSTDHSLVERLVQIGQITREEARTHKQRNVIYSTLGEKRKIEIGYYQTALNPGDRLLLCSDGLSEKLPDEEIFKISHHQADPALAIQMLVEAAKQAGGDDNITGILIQRNE
ncbi:MAG: Stp1/IreP family PP2C-type Ser/Thr phosphatase [Anaerolineaceae bacterium]|nr:Stp1/IreP family PP2C-type Ser/Thr phosphatase [Anaerolineaceae bacterium]